MIRPALAAESTNTFGFTGPETYPIDPFIAQLHAADLNGDGLNDIIVVNNSRSKITLLYNQTGKTNRTAAAAIKRELNELPPDARFTIESIASEKRIAALIVADLNGDKKPDLAYYGEPKELVVQYNKGTNGWSAPKRYVIDDGQLTPNALAFGDLNGDGRTDLVLLGDSSVYFLAQLADHSLAEPEKIPYSGSVKSVQVLDINGDGRDDLLLVNWDSANPFRFRLQNKQGQLGPEIHFAMSPVRSYAADDLDGDHKTEIITIAMTSGRAQIYDFEKKPAETLLGNTKQGQFQVLPLTKTTKARRGMNWADLNGDGLPDLLVSEPDTGQLTIYLQQQDGTLGQSKSFPILTGVTEIQVNENGKAGVPEIYLLSSEERQIGVTHYEKSGRVPFPTVLPVEGKPLALALGKLNGKQKPVLASILDQDGKRVLYLRDSDGKVRIQKLSENFKSNPSAMAFQDANQDGLMDLVILIPYEKIKILLQQDDKDFNEVDVLPPGGNLEQPWMSVADVDGDGKLELLLAQKNFLRAVVLKQETEGTATNKSWGFVVKDQINASAGNSRITGAAALPNGTNAFPLLFLLDAERKSLTVCERNTNGVWQIARNVLLPFTEFSEIHPLALGAKQPNSIAFSGLNAAAWMSLKGDIWDLVEMDGYETPIKDGQLHDVVTGDLNQDGRKDLVFLETAKNYLDLVIYKNRQLIPATRWQVFEERTYRGRRSDAAEPREALVVDVTGDGKNDLVVIVHDRVIIYPQE